MPPKKQSKAEAPPQLTPAQQKKREAAAAKALEEETREKERLAEIAADPLLVRHSESYPAITVSQLFTTVIKRHDFSVRPAVKGAASPGKAAFDWTEFKAALATRNKTSPTWFAHARTEDLILEPDGCDGEHVPAVVIVEASEPTLAPMHMVIRELRPFSDPEDNTPERVVKLADHGLCWREVRGDAGEELNMFLLQQSPKKTGLQPSFSFGALPTTTKPAAPAPSDSAASKDDVVVSVPTVATAATTATTAFAGASPVKGFGAAAAAPTSAVAGAIAAGAALASAAASAGSPPTLFGGVSPQRTPSFGTTNASAAVAPTTTTDAAAAKPTPSFGFGVAAPPKPQAAPPAFGSAIGAATAGVVKAPSFGFGATAPVTPSPATASSSSQPAATFAGREIGDKPAAVPQVGGFAKAVSGFGNKPNGGSAALPMANGAEKLDVVSFTLWTEERLKEMKKEINAGSRIIIEDFKISPDRTIKLQMHNDLKDSVDETIEQVIRKEFARRDAEMKKIDAWQDDCPVYQEKLHEALQKFRDSWLSAAIKERRALYDTISNECRDKIKAKLEECVRVRKEMLAAEAAVIDDIMRLVKKQGVLATKDKFRVLKYYPKNDVLRFRPYGKVSGVHEACETADVCVPPPYVMTIKFGKRV